MEGEDWDGKDWGRGGLVWGMGGGRRRGGIGEEGEGAVEREDWGGGVVEEEDGWRAQNGCIYRMSLASRQAGQDGGPSSEI